MLPSIGVESNVESESLHLHTTIQPVVEHGSNSLGPSKKLSKNNHRTTNSPGSRTLLLDISQLPVATERFLSILGVAGVTGTEGTEGTEGKGQMLNKYSKSERNTDSF